MNAKPDFASMALDAVDSYNLLGLDPSASSEEIRQAYKKGPLVGNWACDVWWC